MPCRRIGETHAPHGLKRRALCQNHRASIRSIWTTRALPCPSLRSCSKRRLTVPQQMQVHKLCLDLIPRIRLGGRGDFVDQQICILGPGSFQRLSHRRGGNRFCGCAEAFGDFGSREFRVFHTHSQDVVVVWPKLPQGIPSSIEQFIAPAVVEFYLMRFDSWVRNIRVMCVQIPRPMATRSPVGVHQIGECRLEVVPKSSSLGIRTMKLARENFYRELMTQFFCGIRVPYRTSRYRYTAPWYRNSRRCRAEVASAVQEP